MSRNDYTPHKVDAAISVVRYTSHAERFDYASNTWSPEWPEAEDNL